MFSTLLVATLMGSVALSSKSWAPVSSRTYLQANETINREDAWLGWVRNFQLVILLT